MSRKAISPLIGAILIVGFTVAIAAVVMFWSAGFIKSTTSTTEEKVTEQVTLLRDLEMKVRDASVNLTDSTIKIKVENKNEKKIEGFIVKLYGTDGTFTNDTIDIPLDALEIKYIIVGYNGSIGNITRIEVIPKVIVNQKEIAATLQSDEFLAPLITGAVPSGEFVADANTVLLFHFDKDASDEGEAKEYPSDPAMVGWWHLNGDATDSSGNGNDGTVNGATLTTGKFGNAYSFDGSNDYIDYGSASSTDFNSDEDFTLEAWVKPTSATTGAIISKENNKESGYNLIYTKDNKIAFVVGGTVANSLILELDASNINSYSGSGTTWSDISGYGYDFIGYGGLNADNFSKAYPHSFDFDGVYSRFSRASQGISLDGKYDFTWEAWVNPDSISSGAAFARQALKDDYMGLGSVYVRRYQTSPATGGSPQTGVWQQLIGKGDSTKLYVYLNGAEVGSASNTQPFSGTFIKWFVGCQHDAYAQVSTGFNGNISLVRTYNRTLTNEEINQNFESVAYRFGLTNDATTTNTINLNEYSHIVAKKEGTTCSIYINGVLSKSFSCNISQDLTGNLQIGRRASGVREYFNGVIDEVAIYNKALSTTEIAPHVGFLAKDYSSKGNNGTLENGVNWTTSGKYGSALSFDGVDDYVLVNHSGQLQFKSGNFSVEVWAKPDTISVYTGLITTDTTGDGAWKIYMDGGKSYFSARYGSTSLAYPAIITGVWHHYGYVKEGTTLKIYLDGELVNSSTCPATHSVDNNELAFGSYRVQNAKDKLYIYDGNIDEVRISNIARTY